ncbi:MAG: glycosyltransferase [Terrimicrobiaceae bacterium]|nr:glycosyltransferase [Terrimicrobiaceae bacterium]
MALKTVLVLTSGFGEGHNAAAGNLAAALREKGVNAGVHDIFAEAYGRANGMARDLYLLVINHAPMIWGAVFFVLDRTSLAGGGMGVFGRAARLLGRMISRLQPDVIVSTYPGYGHLLDLIRRRNEAGDARLVTIVTDSLTVNSVWFRCGSDYFLVPNDSTAGAMSAAGVPSEKIRVTGFPVPLVFSEPDPRVTGPVYDVLFMVNSAHHLAAGVVASLIEIENIRLTVTVGRDAGLRRMLENIAKTSGKHIEIHGWTPDMPNLIRRSHLLISKAGGATVQEALAARTPMIITQIIPGQEEGNARLLIESGAGELATTPAAISDAVRRTFREGGRLYRERHAATGPLSHPNSARTAAAFLESLV